MARLRPFLPVVLGVLVGAALLFLLLRGFRDQTGVPDTTSTVGVVTSDPDPRPTSADPSDGPMSADGSTSGSGDGGNRPPPFDRPLALRGVVLDDTGRTLSGARVTVQRVAPERLRGAPYPDGPVLTETRTDRDGRFELEAPPDAWLRVMAHADGHASMGRLVAGTGAEVRLVLPPAGMLAVTILDAAGKPVGGAAVEAQVRQTLAQVTTNADGLASFNHLPPGEAHLRAGADGHGTVRAGPYAIRAGETARADVTLTAGVRVSGIVRDDATGAAIAGAQVYFARPGQSTDAGRTDAKGRFAAAFAGGLGERIFVSVDAEGYAPALVPLILRPIEEGLQTTEVRLKPGTPWQGEVLFPRGVDAGPVTVRYSGNGVADRTPATVTADAGGRFVLPPPPDAAPGRRVILLAEAGPWRAALALRPGQLQPRPLQLVMTRANAVSGIVRLAARDERPAGPAAGAVVRLVPRWDLAARRGLSPADHLLRASNEAGLADLTVATDATGRWVLQGIPDGDYDRYITWRGEGRWIPGVLSVSGNLDAGTTVLGTGLRIEGQVSEATGPALTGVRVRLLRRAEPPRVVSVFTDSEGAFAFEDLAPGDYELRTSLAGFESRTADVTVLAEGAAPEPLDLRLERAAGIEGMLRRDGKPYKGAFRVHLRPAQRAGRGRAPTTLRTDNGRFTLPAPPDGTWSLTVTTPDGGMATAREHLEARAGDVLRIDLDLMRGARLEGTVRRHDGTPVPAARIIATETTSGRRALGHAMEDGRYRIDELVAGSYIVQFSGAGGVPVQVRVTLDLGQTETLDADLPRGGHVRVKTLDVAGRTLGGVVLLFRTDTQALPGTPPDRTDRHGSFLRRHLPTGQIHVRARLGEREARGSLYVVEGKTLELRLTLE